MRRYLTHDANALYFLFGVGDVFSVKANPMERSSTIVFGLERTYMVGSMRGSRPFEDVRPRERGGGWGAVRSDRWRVSYGDLPCCGCWQRFAPGVCIHVQSWTRQRRTRWSTPARNEYLSPGCCLGLRACGEDAYLGLVREGQTKRLGRT